MTKGSFFKWTNWIPIKLNCFAWRLFQNRIPLLDNLYLSARGINVSSSLCSFCGAENENLDHVFFSVEEFLRLVWAVQLFTRELLEAFRCFKGNVRSFFLLLSIAYVSLWGIWKERNARLFRKERKSVLVTFDDLCLLLFNFLKDRSNLHCLDWHLWIMSPFNCI